MPISQLSIYDWPAEMKRSPHFSVSINGQSVPVCATGVAAFLVIAFEGAIEFEVSVEAAIQTAQLRPLSRNITTRIEDRTVRFRLERADNFSLEIDGLMPLFVFANAPESARPEPNDAGVHFFAAEKTHEIGQLEIKSGESVYIEGGAVVRGVICGADAQNITIRGHGILDGSLWQHDNDAHYSVLWEKCRCSARRHRDDSPVDVDGDGGAV